jgi:ribosomal protein S18 acetylase RimI-like enzyme
MKIQNTVIADLDIVLQRYRDAIDYQRKHGYNLWPEFDRQMITKEILEGRHWKMTEDEQVACVFSVVYSDPVIWKEKDLDDAIYLHRIATNPEFKGRNFISRIVQWSKEHARENKRQYIRMDTWGDNENLSNYYIRAGFKFLKKQHITKDENLPPHYWGIYLNLFEIDLHLEEL